jgi:hypothetical protein
VTVPVTAASPSTPAHSLRVSSPAAATAPVAPPTPQYAAQASQPSPYPSSSPGSDAGLSAAFGGTAHGREARGGYWPGSRNGAAAPRLGGIRGNFAGVRWRIGPGNRPLCSWAFLAGPDVPVPSGLSRRHRGPAVFRGILTANKRSKFREKRNYARSRRFPRANAARPSAHGPHGYHVPLMSSAMPNGGPYG